jgi:hypothetical protein
MPVYLIRQGLTGPVKIGVANDAVKRLRQLQTNQPIVLRIVRLLEGDRAEEAALHQRFQGQRLKGEWFTFCAEMDGDLGLADLPIPMVRRNFGRGHADNAHGRERQLHDEILIAIGGASALGRRMRMPPWEVAPNLIKQRYWSATVLLLVDAGRHDITLDMLFEAQAATAEANRHIREHNARIEKKRLEDIDARRERDWVEKHGAAAAWWALREPEPAAASAEKPEAA